MYYEETNDSIGTKFSLQVTQKLFLPKNGSSKAGFRQMLLKVTNRPNWNQIGTTHKFKPPLSSDKFLASICKTILQIRAFDAIDDTSVCLVVIVCTIYNILTINRRGARHFFSSRAYGRSVL